MELPGAVFVLNAADQIGRARFGEAWSGAEIFTLPLPALPATPSLAGGFAERLALYKELHGFLPRFSKLVDPNIEFSEEQWLKLRELRLRKILEAAPLLRRADETFKFLQEEVASGRVVASTCSVFGGYLQRADQLRAEWSARQLQTGMTADGSSWVFIPEGDLESALRRVRSAWPSTRAEIVGRASEAQVRRYFRQSMDKWNGFDPPNEEDHLESLQSEIGKRISRARYREVRKTEAPQWRRTRGRPAKTPKNSPRISPES